MSEDHLIARKVHVAVPARGWVAKFKDGAGFHRRPVIAWTYSTYAEAGPGFDKAQGTKLWGGLIGYEDGPSEATEAVNFVGFEPVDGWGDL